MLGSWSPGAATCPRPWHVFLEPLAGCGGSAVASGVAGGDARLGEGQNAQLAGEDGGGSARTGRLQKARETAAAILSFGRSIEI